jgi:glycosyltransferase involved in cell wall biosynthesis
MSLGRLLHRAIVPRTEVKLTPYAECDLLNVAHLAEKIDLIPHGIPDLPFAEPDAYKDSLSLGGKFELLILGLLSTNKGFECAIRALPRICPGTKT